VSSVHLITDTIVTGLVLLERIQLTIKKIVVSATVHKSFLRLGPMA